MLCNSTFEFRHLSIEELRPNGYNPNRMSPGHFDALKRTIQKNGFLGVALVRISPPGYAIIDGEHRWRAAMELKLAQIPCAIVPVSEEEARALTIKVNQIHGDWIPDLLAELVNGIPEPFADLGFADGEIEELLKQVYDVDALLANRVSLENAALNESLIGDERYLGFNLSTDRRKLLDEALQAALPQNQDLVNSRAGCLEVILRSFLGAAAKGLAASQRNRQDREMRLNL